MQSVIKKNGRSIKIEKPTIRSSEEEQLWREAVKYSRLIPAEVEPNMGRVLEIKEEIRKGIYPINSDVIRETASRIALRFLRKE